MHGLGYPTGTLISKFIMKLTFNFGCISMYLANNSKLFMTIITNIFFILEFAHFVV